MVESVYDEDKRLKNVTPYLIQGFSFILIGDVLYQLFTQVEGALYIHRFESYIEYPNTFAVIIGALFFYSFYASFLSQDRLMTLFLRAPLALQLFMLFGSESRGALVIFFVIGVFSLFLFCTNKQLKILASAIIILFEALLMYWLYLSQYEIYFIMMILLSFGINSVLPVMFNRIKVMRPMPRFLIPLGLLMMMGTGLWVILTNHSILSVLPENISSKLSRLNQLNSLESRGVFYEDALALVKQAPLIGSGAGTWETTYYVVQSYPYQSKESHNGYLDFMMDVGLLGTVIIFIVFGFIIYCIFKKLKEEDRFIFVPVAYILAHSLMDFNFAYGFIWFLLIWLISPFVHMTGTLENQRFSQLNQSIVKKGVIIIIAVMSLTVLIVSFRFNAATQAERTQPSLSGAMRNAELNPFNPSYRMNVLLLDAPNMTQEDFLNEGEAILALEPENAELYSQLALLYNRFDLLEEALGLLIDAAEYDPYHHTHLEITGDLALRLYHDTEEENMLKQTQRLMLKSLDTYQGFKEKQQDFALNSRGYRLTNKWITEMLLIDFLLGERELTERLILIDDVPEELKVVAREIETDPSHPWLTEQLANYQ